MVSPSQRPTPSPTRSRRASKFGKNLLGKNLRANLISKNKKYHKIASYDFNEIPERDDVFSPSESSNPAQGLKSFIGRHKRGFATTIKKANDGLKLSTEFLKDRREKLKKKVDRQEDQRDIFDKYTELVNYHPDAKNTSGAGMMNINDAGAFLKSFVK